MVYQTSFLVLFKAHGDPFCCVLFPKRFALFPFYVHFSFSHHFRSSLKVFMTSFFLEIVHGFALTIYSTRSPCLEVFQYVSMHQAFSLKKTFSFVYLPHLYLCLCLIWMVLSFFRINSFVVETSYKNINFSLQSLSIIC